jgi:hypothetical protein
VRIIAALLAVVIALTVAPSASAVEQSALTASASQARSQVTSLVREYEAQYGPRVSVAERAQLRSMVREARSDMNSLVRLVRKAERTKRSPDWRRAYEYYVDIRATADDRLAQVRDILGPQMSFSEQLGAWSQARSVLQELDSLGNQLKRRAR